MAISKSNLHAAVETWLRSVNVIHDNEDVDIDLEASGDIYQMKLHLKEANLVRD